MVVDEVQREGAGERKRKKERQWERERRVGGEEVEREVDGSTWWGMTEMNSFHFTLGSSRVPRVR